MSKIFMMALSLMLFSCGNKDNQIENIIFSENGGDIEFQKTYKILDVPDSLVLGSVSQVKILDERVFLLASGVLHSFDNTGRYIGSVGGAGRGEGEYIMPMSFNTYKNEIYIVDCGKRTVISYDIETLKFIREYKQPVDMSSISYLNDKTIVSYGQMNSDYFNYINAGYSNVEKSFVENFRGVENSGYNAGTYNPMCNVDDKIMLYTPFSTIIYEATEGGIMPKYSLKLSNFETPDRDFLIKISQNPNFFSELRGSGFISYYTYFETKQAILVSFFVEGERYVGFYKKGDSEGKVSKTNNLYDGGNIVGVNDDCFVAYVEAGQENVPENDIVLLLIK